MIASALRMCRRARLVRRAAAGRSRPGRYAGAAGAAGAGAGAADTGAGGGIASSDCRASRRRARQKDLEVNVGDRVFFDFDSSVLDDGRAQTLERQAAWLKQYPDVTVTDRGPCRPARHHRVQPGARRAARQRGEELSGRARHRPRPHPDHLLRRGAAGRPGHDEAAFAQNRRAVTVVNVTDQLMSRQPRCARAEP